MHQIYKTRAFIFKKNDRADKDRIFSVFAEDFGRMEVFAKSIRAITSKLKGGMEVFCVSDIEFIQGKHHKTLTSAVSHEKFGNIVAVPEKMEVAGKVSGLLDDFIKGQELDPKIWTLILDFFEKLHNCPLPTSTYRLTYYYFFWNFISVLGYKPQLFKCAHCNQKLDPAHVHFSHKEGGAMCQACAGNNKNCKKINSNVVKMVRLFLERDWQTILKLKIEPLSYKLLQEISTDYYNHLSSALI